VPVMDIKALHSIIINTFTIGIVGVLYPQKCCQLVFMCVEVMLNAVNLLLFNMHEKVQKKSIA
jgi:NADH:ubiquinone oxidoreductase subunit K